MPFMASLGAGERHLRLVFEVAALGGRQRCAGRIAFAVVDDAKLVPGERILIVLVHGDLQDLLGLREILRVFGRDQRMAEHGRDHRCFA